MAQLTLEKAKELLKKLQYANAQMGQLSLNDEMYKQALEIAIPTLEQQDHPKNIEEKICDFISGNYSRYKGAFLCGKSAEIACYLLNMAGKTSSKLSCEINGVGHVLVKSGDFYIDPSIKQFGNYPEFSKGNYPILGVQLNYIPKIDSDDWIVWPGGNCPIDKNKVVYVKFRNGDVDNGGAKAGTMDWFHFGEAWDIIAYRLVKP